MSESVRIALGARRWAVALGVIRQGLGLAVVGVAIGLAAALLLSRYVESLLFGVVTTDPVTYVVVPVLLTVVAALAAYLPARRVTRIDPVEALRAE